MEGNSRRDIDRPGDFSPCQNGHPKVSKGGARGLQFTFLTAPIYIYIYIYICRERARDRKGNNRATRKEGMSATRKEGMSPPRHQERNVGRGGRSMPRRKLPSILVAWLLPVISVSLSLFFLLRFRSISISMVVYTSHRFGQHPEG